MRWSKEEIDFVLKLLKSGNSYKEISILNNRTECSIKNKMQEIGENSSTYKKEMDDIKCLNCGDFFKTDDIRRKFCSQSCSAIFNNKLRVPNRLQKQVAIKYKNCLNCNNNINKKNKYCNNECQRSYERNERFKRIENGDTTLFEKNYKKYLIQKYGNKCMNCEWCEIHPMTGKVPIQLEHIDGNSGNNNLENIKLLCPNCHSLTLTYGALNKGHGRKNRKR